MAKLKPVPVTKKKAALVPVPKGKKTKHAPVKPVSTKKQPPSPAKSTKTKPEPIPAKKAKDKKPATPAPIIPHVAPTPIPEVAAQPPLQGECLLGSLQCGDTFKFPHGSGMVIEQEGQSTRVEMTSTSNAVNKAHDARLAASTVVLHTNRRFAPSSPRLIQLRFLVIGQKFHVPETGHEGEILAMNPSQAKVRISRTLSDGGSESGDAYWSTATEVKPGKKPIPQVFAHQPAAAALASPVAVKPAGKAPQSPVKADSRGNSREDAPDKRARYTLCDGPVTGVIRWMQAQGWDRVKIRQCLNANGCKDVSDTTIGIQMAHARKGAKPIPVLTAAHKKLLVDSLKAKK